MLEASHARAHICILIPSQIHVRADSDVRSCTRACSAHCVLDECVCVRIHVPCGRGLVICTLRLLDVDIVPGAASFRDVCDRLHR